MPFQRQFKYSVADVHPRRSRPVYLISPEIRLAITKPAKASQKTTHDCVSPPMRAAISKEPFKNAPFSFERALMPVSSLFQESAKEPQ